MTPPDAALRDLVEEGLRDIPSGAVTIVDTGVSQKLSPTSPSQPFFAHDARRPRRPPREVHVEAFRLGATPVTRGLWARVRGASLPPEPQQPQTLVSFLDAVAWCNALSQRCGLAPAYRIDGEDVQRDVDATGYRLPTEAEWQHACGPAPSDLAASAWFVDTADGRVHDVAMKAANARGLFDMLGNVWEWCEDHFDVEVYGSYRVFRGGGFADEARTLRPGVRRKSHPTWQIDDLGFRLARSVEGVGCGVAASTG